MYAYFVTRKFAIIILCVGMVILGGCAPVPAQDTDLTFALATSQSTTANIVQKQGDKVIAADVDRVPFSDDKSLQDLMHADLVIEGKVVHQTSRLIQPRATETELHDSSVGTPFTDSEVVIDKVLKGQYSSPTVVVVQFGGTVNDYTVVDPEEPLLQIGDTVILFLRDISGDPAQAPGQTKYMITVPSGLFRIDSNENLSTHLSPASAGVADTYRGKDKSVLEKDIQDLAAKLPQPKAVAFNNAVGGAHLVIEATIKEIKEVRLIPEEGKSEGWIKQMLSEGKMPGDVYTDYVVTINKVLFDKFSDQPRFFPDRKPLQPGQTIIVTWRGGTYEGVTQTYERGVPFEVGGREVMFLQDIGIMTGDPDYHSPRYQVRYSLVDSVRARLPIGHDGTFAALDGRGLSDFYAGQSVEQLEKDLAEFLKAQPPAQMIPAPAQP
jgi:hypothetical protein